MASFIGRLIGTAIGSAVVAGIQAGNQGNHARAPQPQPREGRVSVQMTSGLGASGGQSPRAVTTANAGDIVGDGNELNNYEDKNSLHIRSLVWSIFVWISLPFFLVACLVNHAFWMSGDLGVNIPVYYYGSYCDYTYDTSSTYSYWNFYYYANDRYADTGCLASIFYSSGSYSSSNFWCQSKDIPWLCWGSLAFPFFAFCYYVEALICVCDRCVKCNLGSSTCRYVTNIKSDSSSEKFIAKLHAQHPSFRMYVECYHYETRYRTVSDGNGGTRTESYQVRVVTHTATGWIQYDTWVDCSTSVEGLGLYRLVKMELSKSYQYADSYTAQEFDRQREQFKRENDRDVYQDYTETYIVAGYEQYALCCRHGQKPCYLGCGGYFMATLMLLSWAYRRWVEVLAVSTRIRIRKRVRCGAPPDQSLALLVGYYHQVRDEQLTECIVYHMMYNEPHPDMSREMNLAATNAMQVVIPKAQYAGEITT